LSATQLAAVFGALSDPTRLAIVERLLSEGERTAGEIAEPFAVSKPAISKHLKVLEDAGLVRRRLDGRRHVLSLESARLLLAEDWIDRYRTFWNQSLTRMADLAAEIEQGEDP